MVVFLEASHVTEWKDKSVASAKSVFTGRQKQEAEKDDDDDDDFDLGKRPALLPNYVINAKITKKRVNNITKERNVKRIDFV